MKAKLKIIIISESEVIKIHPVSFGVIDGSILQSYNCCCINNSMYLAQRDSFMIGI